MGKGVFGPGGSTGTAAYQGILCDVSATLASQFLDTTEPRARLLLAMASAIEEKGFNATTVADVVRIAKVSRRTFYEQFGDRDECFLELYDATGDWLLRLVGEAASVDVDWPERV